MTNIPVNPDSGRADPSFEGHDTAFGPENPAHVVPLVTGSGNRQLLSEWISDHPEYAVVDTDPDADTLRHDEFDLCILDREALHTYTEPLRSRKEAASPVQLPYLLVYPEEDPRTIESDTGKLVDTILPEAIDEIVSLPLKKAELARRVEALLRIRSQSLDLAGEQRQLQRFKQATDSAGHAVYITDADGTIEYVNPAFERITGYEAEDAVGENPRILNSGEMSDEYFADLWDTVNDGEIWEEEVINERKNGDLYHAEQTIAPISGPRGTIDSYVAIQNDITQRKRERRTLEQYKQGVESATDLLAAVDTDLEFLYANEKYCRYHGLDTGTIEGKRLPNILGDESYAEAADAVNAALQGEKTRREISRDIPDRGERILDALFFPILDDNGDVQGAGATMRDVTEQREHERQLEALIGNLPGVVYRCEHERGWPMEFVRGQSIELTGYDPEQIEKGSISWGEDIIHPDDRETVWTQITDAIAAEEPFEITYRIITRSGEVKWVWERGRKVTPVDSDESKLEGFISDITERKQREQHVRELNQQLMAEKERYESLFTSIRDAILVADTDRRIINCNPAFTELFGYELTEIKGKPTKYVYESEAEFEEIGEAIEGHTGDREFTHSVTYEKRSGQTFKGETNFFYLKNVDGEIVGFIGVIRDVSGRENRLTQLQVIDRVLQHNFHNDMNVIEGYAEQIESGGSPPFTNYAETIKETGKKLLETVEKEREITQFLSDPPATGEFDATRMTERAVDHMATRYPDANITTTYTNGTQMLASEYIYRAIEELITNSIIHSDSEAPQVTIRVTRNEERTSISIADENPLIPEMERNVLTGDEELSPLYHGSGLGLWLVTLIVNHSDGVIEFRENDPRGNIVEIRLPSR